MKLPACRSDGLCRFTKRGYSSSGSNVMSSASAEEIVVSPDERRIRWRVNSDLLVTSTWKSSSSSAGGGSFKDVKMGSLTDAGTLLTVTVPGEGEYASCVEIAMLSNT